MIMAGKALVPSGCEILNCTCVHDYQDKRYGKNRRVHNAKKSKAGGIEYGCTVCGMVHNYTPQSTPKEA
jgi:hypothetical protein